MDADDIDFLLNCNDEISSAFGVIANEIEKSVIRDLIPETAHAESAEAYYLKLLGHLDNEAALMRGLLGLIAVAFKRKMLSARVTLGDYTPNGDDEPTDWEER